MVIGIHCKLYVCIVGVGWNELGKIIEQMEEYGADACTDLSKSCVCCVNDNSKP